MDVSRIERFREILQETLIQQRVIVQVDQLGNQLNILLTKLPDATISYPGLLEVIKSKIEQFRVDGVNQVKVVGHLQGRGVAQWEQTVLLSPFVESWSTHSIRDVSPPQESVLETVSVPVDDESIDSKSFLPWPHISLGVMVVVITFGVGYGLGVWQREFSSPIRQEHRSR
jgi:hypothetical protein